MMPQPRAIIGAFLLVGLFVGSVKNHLGSQGTRTPALVVVIHQISLWTTHELTEPIGYISGLTLPTSRSSLAAASRLPK